VYTLDLEKFGWRCADLLISTKDGKTSSVAKKLLSSDVVTYVGRSIGEHTIDLRAGIIIKNNAELLDILEKVKDCTRDRKEEISPWSDYRSALEITY
jgi:hypothetical protein